MITLTNMNVVSIVVSHMASLRKRVGSKCWVCCFSHPDGTRTQRSTGKTDKAEAQSICLEWERASKKARQGEFTEAQARKILSEISEKSGLGAIKFETFQSFSEKWLKTKELSKSGGTLRRYKVIINEFSNSLGNRSTAAIANITPTEVNDFRDLQLTEGKSRSTANTAVKTLRILFNSAKRQGLISNNPADAVDLLPAVPQKRSKFTREQIKNLLNVADTEWKGMILIGACHGLRITDVARLTWENYDAERQSLLFRPEKTSRVPNPKTEEIPLHTDVLEYLSSIPVKSQNPKAPLFPNLIRKKANGSTGLSATFRKLMHRAGLFTEGEQTDLKEGKGRRFFELGFHSFRHTATSELANNGVSEEMRMKLTIHKSPEVHKRYTHLEFEKLRAEIKRIPSFLST